MRAAGVYSSATLVAYFRQIGQHFAGAMQALRCAAHPADGELARLAARHIELDESVDLLRTALAAGCGAVLAGPHINNYLLGLALLNAAIPVTVYLRYSKDERRRVAKQRWYHASGVEWISEPPHASGPLGRLGVMSAALRENRLIFITPDLPQKRAAGTPVHCLNREVYFPAGAALLALRARAPLFLLTAELRADRQRWQVRGPFEDGGASADSRRAALLARLQWFATGFTDFVRSAPELWYLWGDKRWTRVFRADPRYTQPRPDEDQLAEPATS